MVDEPRLELGRPGRPREGPSPNAPGVQGGLCQPPEPPYGWGHGSERGGVWPESHSGEITPPGPLTESSEVGVPVVPILQKRRPRHRKARPLGPEVVEFASSRAGISTQQLAFPTQLYINYPDSLTSGCGEGERACHLREMLRTPRTKSSSPGVEGPATRLSWDLWLDPTTVVRRPPRERLAWLSAGVPHPQCQPDARVGAGIPERPHPLPPAPSTSSHQGLPSSHMAPVSPGQSLPAAPPRALAAAVRDPSSPSCLVTLQGRERPWATWPAAALPSGSPIPVTWCAHLPAVARHCHSPSPAPVRVKASLISQSGAHLLGITRPD